MKPNTYFENLYQDDLDLFRDVSNDSLELCPLTLGNYLKDTRLRECATLDCFFACQYCLNLISQAVHCYFPNSMFKAMDYLDVQGCYSHSFRSGDYSRPVDLIHYLKNHSINISMEMLNDYTEYFVTEFLPEQLPEISISDFSQVLLSDSDCMEVHPCFEEIVNEHTLGVSRMRIGKLVKYFIRKIFHYCETEDHSELSRLTDSGYSKETFDINFPFCTDSTQILEDQSRRFWTDTYIVRGRNVRVTSQWFVGSTQQFCDYLIRLGIATQEELTVLIDAANETTALNARNNRQANRNSRYRGNAIGNAQNLVVRNILSNLGQESFNGRDWELTKAHFSHQCAYCGDEGGLVIDHVVPINRSSLGEHRLGNLVPSCRSCNARKADKDYRVFLANLPHRLEFIQAYMDSKNYVPLGDNEQVAMVLNMAYEEVSSVADRYIAILNELFPRG